MTFQESQTVIDQNRIALDKYIMHSNPAHQILGSFVSPKSRSFDREKFIFVEYIENQKDNKQVLLDLNLINQDLIPFVGILIWGNTILIPLDSYISAPWSSIDKDNA